MVETWRSSSTACSEELQVIVLHFPNHIVAISFLSCGQSPSQGPKDQHLYFLDDTHVQASNVELLHGAAGKAPLPLGVVQPDAVAVLILLPNQDDVGPAVGGRVLVLPGGDRHIVGNNCKGSWGPAS